MFTTSIAGVAAMLLHQRGLYLPAFATLLVADTHFGKAGVFRRHGIPLPAGSTVDDLQRLSALVQQTRADRLVILGDFVHAAPRHGEPWLEAFADWRRRHASLQVEVVEGNHDRGTVPALLAGDINWHSAPQILGPFLLCHIPTTVDGYHVIAGHLHPVVRLRDRTDRLRLPVFWMRSECTVLPSFGGLTGGHPVAPRASDRLYAVGPDGVVDCTAAAVRRPSRVRGQDASSRPKRPLR